MLHGWRGVSSVPPGCAFAVCAPLSVSAFCAPWGGVLSALPGGVLSVLSGEGECYASLECCCVGRSPVCAPWGVYWVGC